MNLAELFTENAKQKFSRTFKPEEFQVQKIPIDEEKSDTDEPRHDTDSTKRKKRKKERIRLPKSVVEGGSTTVSTEQVSDSVVGSDDPNIINNDSGSAVSAAQNPTSNKDNNSPRTVFAGNLSVKETTKTITKLFSEFGEVESVRLRSVPISGTKVDDAGNQDLVRKVCVNTQKFGTQKVSFNAYIVYKDEASVKAAIDSANNRVVNDRHIRVDYCNPTHFDPKRTIFLGGLPIYIDEEELREYIAKVLPNGQDDIESVRLIRDSESLIGKGIGYVLLTDKDAVMQALSLNQEVFKKRWPLRISLCGKRTKRMVAAKSKEQSSTDEVEGKGEDKEEKSSSNDEKAQKNKKRKFGASTGGGGFFPKGKPAGDNNAALNAMKRIKLKEKKQKKDKPGRKGKRLGGVVKRAMKAAAAK
eukprot:gene27804-36613_t